MLQFTGPETLSNKESSDFVDGLKAGKDGNGRDLVECGWREYWKR